MGSRLGTMRRHKGAGPAHPTRQTPTHGHAYARTANPSALHTSHTVPIAHTVPLQNKRQPLHTPCRHVQCAVRRTRRTGAVRQQPGLGPPGAGPREPRRAVRPAAPRRRRARAPAHPCLPPARPCCRPAPAGSISSSNMGWRGVAWQHAGFRGSGSNVAWVCCGCWWCWWRRWWSFPAPGAGACALRLRGAAPAACAPAAQSAWTPVATAATARNSTCNGRARSSNG